MKIERYINHTVIVENDIFYYYIFRPKPHFQITRHYNGKFEDTNIAITDLAKLASTEHFNILVLAYCIPNNKK